MVLSYKPIHNRDNDVLILVRAVIYGDILRNAVIKSRLYTKNIDDLNVTNGTIIGRWSVRRP